VQRLVLEPSQQLRRVRAAEAGAGTGAATERRDTARTALARDAVIRLLPGDCREVLATLPADSVHCVVDSADSIRYCQGMNDVASLTETQIAYIAGLIDGEGSLECQKQMQRGAATPIFTLRLSFGFATAEPITTVASWLGMAPKVFAPKQANRQPIWRLHIKNRIALPLLTRSLPYLILKKEQAQLILAIDGVRALNTVPRTMKGGYGAHRRMPAHAVEQMMAMHTALRGMKSNKRPVACRSV